MNRYSGWYREGITHGDPVWKRSLVNDQDCLFVGFLPFNILQHKFVHRSDEDNVRRVDSFVKLAVGK